MPDQIRHNNIKFLQKSTFFIKTLANSDKMYYICRIKWGKVGTLSTVSV
jgi:hypothetical protein